MLVKLIKHEFSATSKIYSTLLIICLVFTAFACSATLLVGRIADSNPVFALIASLPAQLLGSIVLSVMTTFPLYHAAWRFYKNLASNEGYLMHMLPVPTGHLILSKSIVALAWLVVCTLMGFGAYIASNAAYLYVLGQEMSNAFSVTEILMIIQEMFSALLGFVPNLVFVTVAVVLIIILSTVFSLLSLYLCIAIGQLWTAHRILGAFLSYLALSFILNVVMIIAMIVFILVSIQSLVTFYVTLISSVLLILAAVIGCYYATLKIFKNKLNLQ